MKSIDDVKHLVGMQGVFLIFCKLSQKYLVIINQTVYTK